jgi:uncharacterized protein
MKRDRAALAMALALLASTQALHAQQGQMPPRTLTVSATGEAAAVPDIARITAGVATEAPTAKEALARNASAMTKVIAAIKSAGVGSADIQTTSISLSPRYTNARPAEASKLQGFTVRNQVRFAFRRIDALGGIIDTVVAAGANQLHGIAFEVGNEKELIDTARTRAMETAWKRAALYASAAKASLGEVLQIDENVSQGPQPYIRTTRAEFSPTPVEAGSQTLAVTVSVTFALK